MAVGVVIAVLVLVLSLILWLKRDTKYREIIDKIPGPRSTLPILGNAHLLKDGYEGTEQLLQFCEQYGGEKGVTRLWIGTVPYVFLTRADPCAAILNTSTHSKKAPFYRLSEPWLGTGLLTTSNAEKYKTRRRIITPTFHFEILSDFVGVFNEQARIMIQLLDEKAKQNQMFDICPFFVAVALDVICETAMGRHINVQRGQDNGYAKAVDTLTQIVQRRLNSPFLQNDFIFSCTPVGRTHTNCLKTVHDFSRKTIQERSDLLDDQLRNKTGKIKIEDLQSGKPFRIGKQKRLAFLDMLLIAAKGGADLSHADIQEEVDTFMYEGHDTTSSAAVWITYMLGSHPEVQKKAQEEVDEITGGTDRDLTAEDLKEMKYLECVIRESIRLYPAVPMFARELEEDCTISGYLVPKGTSVLIMPQAVHHDPVHFPDPYKFDPDRWLPENSCDRHPYCYVPFSAGNRNCIGQKFAMMEEKVLFSYILRNFNISTPYSHQQIRPVANCLLRPENGLNTLLTKRKPRPPSNGQPMNGI